MKHLWNFFIYANITLTIIYFYLVVSFREFPLPLKEYYSILQVVRNYNSQSPDQMLIQALPSSFKKVIDIEYSKRKALEEITQIEMEKRKMQKPIEPLGGGLNAFHEELASKCAPFRDRVKELEHDVQYCRSKVENLQGLNDKLQYLLKKTKNDAKSQRIRTKSSSI